MHILLLVHTANIDYSTVQTTITFPPGGDATMIARVPITDDTIAEPTEDFEATLTSIGPKVTIGLEDLAFIDILDDDGKYFICETVPMYTVR